MHDRRKTIHANPTGSLHTFDVVGRLAKFLFQPLVDVACNGFDLCCGIPLTDNEKIRGCVVQFPEVQFHYIFPFDVLNAVNDQVIQRFNGGEISC